MAKNICILALIVIFISASQARANDETKRLLGGLAVGIIGMALEEHSKQSDQQEEIEWNDKQQQKDSSAIVSEKTKDMQRDLKELGYYRGVVDGIFGSGTREAILRYKDCSQDDDYCLNRKLDKIDLNVIKEAAENERNNRKIREQNAQRVKAWAEDKKKLAAVTEKDFSDWLNGLRNTVNLDAIFPECRSKEALSDIQDVVKNSAYSNFVNVQIFDLIDAREIPNNIDVLLKEYRLSVLNQQPNFTVKDKTDTAPVFKDKRRLCITNAVTNSGNVPVRYSFHIVEGGVSDDQRYYVEYEEIEESVYSILKSPKFYKRLYVNDLSNK